jgi:reductive dehalogenase
VRIDERDTMFSRKRLEPGSERFESYYRERPENKAPDDLFRSKAGLLSHDAKNYEPLSFAVADANFDTVKSLKPLVDREAAGEAVAIDAEHITRFIKGWALSLGVISVGVTELRDYHLYTTVGRGDDYGKPVTLDHKYAIAITVEMTKAMVDSAPYGPTVVESAQQYLRSGTIAVQIAEFIRNLGYPARAHIDANYRVVCPLVARDAGLGEIGRMGLLMTPTLGPRVRIAVVTTDLPLVTDQRRRDRSMIDFCTICKKCAEVCPAQAIPFEDRVDIDGVKRWRINSETCFTYWCVVGTDCARCVKVCPFSHPDNFMHNTVRMGVRNSSAFRKTALKLDDFFYGRKPAISAFPRWMKT